MVQVLQDPTCVHRNAPWITALCQLLLTLRLRAKQCQCTTGLSQGNSSTSNEAASAEPPQRGTDRVTHEGRREPGPTCTAAHSAQHTRHRRFKPHRRHRRFARRFSSSSAWGGTAPIEVYCCSAPLLHPGWVWSSTAEMAELPHLLLQTNRAPATLLCHAIPEFCW